MTWFKPKPPEPPKIETTKDGLVYTWNGDIDGEDPFEVFDRIFIKEEKEKTKK